MATFTNSATLSYNGNTTVSNVVTGELVEVLAVTKTAVRGDYAANENITYVISIVNSGQTPVTGVAISDNLGEYDFDPNLPLLTPLTFVADSVLYFSNGVLQGEPVISAGPPLTISGITVPAGGNVAIVYEAIPNQFAPLGTGATITNLATVTGNGITTPVEAEVTVAAASDANLTINKAISPVIVAENGQLTYTFTIQNYGNAAADAGDNVVLTDTFAPILRNLTVTYNGIAWSDPSNYAYDSGSGLFTTVPGQITVPAATYTQDPDTGAYVITPGVSILTVSGIV